MKQILLIILAVLIIYPVFQHYFIFTPKVLSDSTPPEPAPLAKHTLNYKEVTRGYVFENNIDPEKLELIPNFTDKIPSESLMKLNNCQYGINGGFYTENSKPIGLFVSSGTKYSDIKNSQIFNGYISIKGNNINITESNQDNFPTELQTGPILIQEQKPLPLNMANDKLARRMIMAKNIFGKILIMTVFDPETTKSGPLLGELPEIVDLISKKENLGITEAINLDGGRASAYYGSEKILPESDPVGSWWCIK